MVRARRGEKRMIDACERRILEFPLGMDAREVAKELKREGWYAWATGYESIVSRVRRCRQKRETEECVWLIPMRAQEAVARSHLVGVWLVHIVLQRSASPRRAP
jgi:hypothetical protein